MTTQADTANRPDRALVKAAKGYMAGKKAGSTSFEEALAQMATPGNSGYKGVFLPYVEWRAQNIHAKIAVPDDAVAMEATKAQITDQLQARITKAVQDQQQAKRIDQHRKDAGLEAIAAEKASHELASAITIFAIDEHCSESEARTRLRGIKPELFKRYAETQKALIGSDPNRTPEEQEELRELEAQRDLASRELAQEVRRIAKDREISLSEARSIVAEHHPALVRAYNDTQARLMRAQTGGAR